MIHAYSENYLDDAMRNLGEAYDFAHTVCHLELDSFFAMFINSGIADLFGNAHAKFVEIGVPRTWQVYLNHLGAVASRLRFHNHTRVVCASIHGVNDKARLLDFHPLNVEGI